MDRLIAILSIFVLVPLTLYQMTARVKTKLDILISGLSFLILLSSFSLLFIGEYHFYKKYKDGELSNYHMFCNNSIELTLFDKILQKHNLPLPVKCNVQK